MMFQKMMSETGMLSSELAKTGAECSFDRLRRQEAARKNRATANCGLFYRKRRVYRHA